MLVRYQMFGFKNLVSQNYLNLKEKIKICKTQKSRKKTKEIEFKMRISIIYKT